MFNGLKRQNGLLILGVDLFNYIDELCDQLFPEYENMTKDEQEYREKLRKKFKKVTLKSFNAFISKGDISPFCIVHVPGLEKITEFSSIIEIRERYGANKE